MFAYITCYFYFHGLLRKANDSDVDVNIDSLYGNNGTGEKQSLSEGLAFPE
ncbi:hypothetical protein GCM10022277_24100 [Litoribacillus peritrichatus]|uniref:Uncharacterized protein n=1 Tax=Litoribacillus peritrichatus TaxID=718191 RepID=A0ABP7MNP3_9GAMM